mgnify:CR=1 FL=1
MLNIFGYTGPVNQIIEFFGGEAVNFFGEAKIFQPLVIGTDIWKGFGYNTVVYLAAILGVDGSLYEAAAVDGCGRFKRIWHVTLPGIKTTVALLAILSLGNILNAGFDQVYNLYNPLVTQQVILLTHGIQSRFAKSPVFSGYGRWFIKICD